MAICGDPPCIYIYTHWTRKKKKLHSVARRRTENRGGVPLTVFDPGNNGQLEQTVAVCETIRATPCYPNTNRLYARYAEACFSFGEIFFHPGPSRDC